MRRRLNVLAFRGERGMALVMAIGMTVVLGMVGVTLASYTISNSRSATYSSGKQTAFTLAQAGIENAMSVLYLSTNDTLDPNLLPERTTTMEGGSVTWSGTLHEGDAVWTITSIGNVNNADVPGTQLHRTLTAKVPITPVYVQPMQNLAWNYIFISNTGNTCDQTLSANVSYSVPLYVLGNLCFSNNSSISGGKVAVGGKITMANTSNFIGSSGSPLTELHSAGGCKWWNNSLHNPCLQGSGASGNDNVWASTIDSTPPSVTPPVANWDHWYAHANPGPQRPCYAPKSSASSTWPVFDNDTTRNASVSSAWNLTPATSYHCWADGGELKWDATNKVLTANGTIFIDGSATVTSSLATYVGHASLYLSGNFSLTSSAKLCVVVASSACDIATGSWDPNQNLLLVVANGSGNSVQLASSAQFQGGLYATNNIDLASSTKWEGPMVTKTLSVGSGVTMYPFGDIASGPVGLPSNPIVYAQPNPPQQFSG
jgi:hypothetical protein